MIERSPTRRLLERLGRQRTRTAVEEYWNRHTVNSKPFRSAEASAAYLEWRFAEYPLFQELTGLWGDHSGERVLDYGCGPGNDVVGFLLYSGAAEVVGVDVSAKALALARRRVRLHDIPEGRFQLMHVREGDERVPLADASIDHVNSGGVIHHVSEPERVLRELRRLLRPRGTCTIMVYNRDSIYFHLYTAYMRAIVERAFGDVDVEEAFRRNTDGPACPISRAFRGSEFLDMCAASGLTGKFAGGYFLKDELEWLRDHEEAALRSEELAEEHKEFLRELETDERGYPSYRGKAAGIGGVYRLSAT